LYILAGLISAVAVRILLGMLNRPDSRLVITLVAPLFEEVAKTGLAVLLSAGVFYTHAIFGAVELLSDTMRGRGIWPGMTALILHSVLGYLTAWIFYAGGLLLPALLAAAVLHSMWNYAAVSFLGRGRNN